MSEDYAITETMLKYGGGFVKALAQAWRAADVHNQRRLRDAFPDYWGHYREMAEERARREAEK